MEKKYYNAESLEHALLSLERCYQMSSSEFYAHVEAGDEIELPRFVRNVWASLYRDFRRLGGNDDFARSVERTLALA